MADNVIMATGRRKTSIAVVKLVKGKGRIFVNGKTAETYADVDAIAGATITTKGYTTAISKMFEAVKILEGEV